MTEADVLEAANLVKETLRCSNAIDDLKLRTQPKMMIVVECGRADKSIHKQALFTETENETETIASVLVTVLERRIVAMRQRLDELGVSAE